jgi:stage V sporulation protein D (sporulation-specific penicillin-binding protein)
MMARVVEEGTGRKAKIPGVRVGGKTGTADKLPERIEVTASFIALAPVERPELVVLVVVDEPKGDHLASTVAAPYVKAILERSLSHLNALCKIEDKPADDRES